MSLQIAVLKEPGSNEHRVAMVPVLVKRLTKLGASLALQTGAGLAAGFADGDYVGATTVDDPLRLVADADIVLAVQAPSADVVAAMKPGAVLASFVPTTTTQGETACLR